MRTFLIALLVALVVSVLTWHYTFAWDLPEGAKSVGVWQSSALPLKFPVLVAPSSSSYVRVLSWRVGSATSLSNGMLSCGSSVIATSQGNSSGTTNAWFVDSFSFNYLCTGQTIWFTQFGTGNQLGSKSVSLNYMDNAPVPVDDSDFSFVVFSSIFAFLFSMFGVVSLFKRS